MVAGRRGCSGTRGDGDSGTRTAGSWAGCRGDLTGGGHMLRGQLGVQLDAVQPDLGRAAGLALVLHGCGDKVASVPATPLSPPAIRHHVCPPPISPSLFMPACRHFLSRQAWHWLRCALSTGHSPVPAWHLWGEVAPGCSPWGGPCPWGVLSPRGVLPP